MNKTKLISTIVVVVIIIGTIIASRSWKGQSNQILVPPTENVSNSSSTVQVTSSTSGVNEPVSTPVKVSTPKATPKSTPAKVTTPASTPAAASGYTMADVATHNTKSSCWTAVNGSVYDVTAWIKEHPGGSEAIIWMCGKDGSSAYDDQHGGQKRPASELAAFKIGALK